MPTYLVYTQPGVLTQGQHDELAEAITALHSRHTGAPRSLVQTIFLPFQAGGHYVGASRTDPRAVWVHGHIRGGRTETARTAIALGICDELERIAGISRKLIWVYLSELAHTDMVEFGAVLPPPGEERQWMDALTPDVRDHVQALD